MADSYAPYDYAWKQPGWTVQNPTVIGDTVTPFNDPGLPSDVSKVHVSGNFLDPITGRPLEGVLSILTSDILIYTPTNEQVMPGVQKIRFRAGEALSVLLPATDDPQLVPNGWKYHLQLTVAGTSQEFLTLLPASPAEVDIWDLTPAP
jgi:hypothetical protein